MLTFPEPSESILGIYNYTKLLKEQHDIQRNSSLPYYMRVLLKKKHDVYMEYIKTRSRANLISYNKLSEICKAEIASNEEEGSVVYPNSPEEILVRLQKELMLSEAWYRVTNVKIFWDIHVGLFQVKEIIYEIRDIKKAEYDILRIINE